jgi:hypothetical protein
LIFESSVMMSSVTLALEALEGGLVLRHLGGQELEGHVAAELRVLGLVDDPHAPAAELRRHPVVGNRPADHGSALLRGNW